MMATLIINDSHTAAARTTAGGDEADDIGAATSRQARGGWALRELQELDPARQMRLRALLLTNREASLTLTEDGGSRVRPGGALARLFEKPGGELLRDLTGQLRLELCRRLLATWEAVLGDGWRVQDLLGVLESSQDESETVYAAMALLQALIAGGQRDWFLTAGTPISRQPRAKTGRGCAVPVGRRSLDELLASGWSAVDILRAFDFICDEELSFRSAQVVAGKTNMLEILVGIILVGRLGVPPRRRRPSARTGAAETRGSAWLPGSAPYISRLDAADQAARRVAYRAGLSAPRSCGLPSRKRALPAAARGCMCLPPARPAKRLRVKTPDAELGISPADFA